MDVAVYNNVAYILFVAVRSVQPPEEWFSAVHISVFATFPMSKYLQHDRMMFSWFRLLAGCFIESSLRATTV